MMLSADFTPTNHCFLLILLIRSVLLVSIGHNLLKVGSTFLRLPLVAGTRFTRMLIEGVERCHPTGLLLIFRATKVMVLIVNNLRVHETEVLVNLATLIITVFAWCTFLFAFELITGRLLVIIRSKTGRAVMLHGATICEARGSFFSWQS